jgi:5'-nucleotidase
MLRVLLTNDDGIDAEGLQALRRALLEVPGIDLHTIAPDGNRSAIGRGITTRKPLVVERVAFDAHGPFEFTVSTMRADRYEIRSTLYT